MRRLLMVLGCAGMAGVGVYTWRAGEPATATAAHDAKLLRDRMWIDHVPRGETDPVQLFVVLSQRPRVAPFGMFEKVSRWEGHFEGFAYEVSGSELRVVFPQRGDRETLTVNATTCNTGGMDYCLEVSGSKRGVSRYYSRKGWEIRDAAQARQLATTLAP